MLPEQLYMLAQAATQAGNAARSSGSLARVAKVSAQDYKIGQDKESEASLLHVIRHLGFPCYIISEESGTEGNPLAEYQVFVDPLDGSVNCSRRIPTFCVGIGVYRNYEPVAGIVYDPNIGPAGELFVAERGKGVTLNGRPFTPAGRPADDYENLLVNLEWSGASHFETVNKQLGRAGIRRRTAGSGVLALLYGAIGRGDGAVLLENKPWDVAPGLVFAAELGHTCLTLAGTAIDLTQASFDIVIAPPAIHPKIVDALAA